MTEPKPDIQKEAEREKLGKDFYKFYFLFQQVANNVGSIMAGKDAADYNDIPDDEKEMRSILKHGIGNWIMAPTMPVMSGRMLQFVDSDKNIELDRLAEELLQDVSQMRFTWSQRIEKGQVFIKKCLEALYPNSSIEAVRKQFGGEDQERTWLEKYREEKKEKNLSARSPRT